MDRLTRGGAAILMYCVLGCNLDSQQQPKFNGTASPGWQQANRAKIENAEVEADPEILPVTHFAAGQLFEQRGQLAESVLQYRKAIDLNPKFVTAYNRLGVCLDRLGRFQEADKCFREAIRLVPSAAYLHNNLGFSLMMQRRWADATAAFRLSLKASPNFTRARINIGMALAHQGLYEQAWAHFEEAVGTARAHYNMGLVYEAQGRSSDATDAFRKALVIDPQLKNAEHHLQELQRQAGTRPTRIEAPWPDTISTEAPLVAETFEVAQAAPAIVQPAPAAHAAAAAAAAAADDGILVVEHADVDCEPAQEDSLDESDSCSPAPPRQVVIVTTPCRLEGVTIEPLAGFAPCRSLGDVYYPNAPTSTETAQAAPFIVPVDDGEELTPEAAQAVQAALASWPQTSEPVAAGPGAAEFVSQLRRTVAQAIRCTYADRIAIAQP